VRPSLAGPLSIALLLSAISPAPAAEPSLAPGALVAGGDAGRFSLRARGVSAETLRSDIHAQTGLTIIAPGDSRISVEFADLPAREGAARIGAALGGLVPLRASWSETSPGAQAARIDTYYLVRPGTRRQQLLDAYGLEQGGAAHQHLFVLLRGEGASIVPDTSAHARDATRGEGERVLTIKLLGSLGVAEASPPLTEILREGPGAMARQAAAIALGLAGRPEPLAELRAALADRDPDVALSAAWALTRLGDSSGVPLALSHLRGSHALRALDVIAETQNAAHIPALEAALGSLRGLARVRARTTSADLSMARLDESGKIAECERLLADPDFEMRRHGAKTLAALSTAAAEGAIARVAADATHAGRGEAGEAAARLRRSRTPPPIVTIE